MISSGLLGLCSHNTSISLVFGLWLVHVLPVRVEGLWLFVQAQ